MKNATLAMALAAALAAACATPGTRTAVGAGAGGATGAVVGGALGGWKGAAVGAAVGAVAGGAAGNLLDKQAAELKAKDADASRTASGILVKLKEDLLFTTGSDVLKPEAVEQIASLGDILAKYPDDRIEVRGYTDSTGSESFNEQLSYRRAGGGGQGLGSRGGGGEEALSAGPRGGAESAGLARRERQAGALRRHGREAAGGPQHHRDGSREESARRAAHRDGEIVSHGAAAETALPPRPLRRKTWLRGCAHAFRSKGAVAAGIRPGADRRGRGQIHQRPHRLGEVPEPRGEGAAAHGRAQLHAGGRAGGDRRGPVGAAQAPDRRRLGGGLAGGNHGQPRLDGQVPGRGGARRAPGGGRAGALAHARAGARPADAVGGAPRAADADGSGRHHSPIGALKARSRFADSLPGRGSQGARPSRRAAIPSDKLAPFIRARK